jgi:hypothetical protein
MPPLYSTVGWGKVRRVPVAVKICIEASSAPHLEAEDEAIADAETVAEGECCNIPCS